MRITRILVGGSLGRRALAGVLSLAGAAALAQSPPPASIVSEGSATSDVTPTYVEFELTRRATGNSLVESMRKALAFEEALDAVLEKEELRPATLLVLGPTIPSAQKAEAIVGARLRFDLSVGNTAVNRALAYAALTDGVRRVADELQCTIAGPKLGVYERDAIEQETIARATENALYKADPIAAIMDARIVAVHSVAVLEVAWAGSGLGRHGVSSIACTARVRVTYDYQGL